MAAPHQRAAFQSEDALRCTADGARFRMRVIAFIGETFKIILRAPRILIPIFALPVHDSFLARLVAFHGPLARPGEAFALDVAAFFHWLRRRKLWRRLSMYRHNRKH